MARPKPTDYTQMTKAELYAAFALISSLFFLWGFSYGLLDVLNQHCKSFRQSSHSSGR